MLFSSKTGEGNKSSKLSEIVFFLENLSCPVLNRNFFDGGASGEAEGAIGAAKVVPKFINNGGVALEVVFCDGVTLSALLGSFDAWFGRRGAFGACLCNSVDS